MTVYTLKRFSCKPLIRHPVLHGGGLQRHEFYQTGQWYQGRDSGSDCTEEAHGTGRGAGDECVIQQDCGAPPGYPLFGPEFPQTYDLLHVALTPVLIRGHAYGVLRWSGSYGCLAAFKAEILSGFVSARGVSTMIEFGYGEGWPVRPSRLAVPSTTPPGSNRPALPVTAAGLSTRPLQAQLRANGHGRTQGRSSSPKGKHIPSPAIAIDA